MNKIIKVYKTNQEPGIRRIGAATSYYVFNDSIARDLDKIALCIPIHKRGNSIETPPSTGNLNLYFLFPSQQVGCYLQYKIEESEQLVGLEIESFSEKIPEQLEQIINKYNFKLEESL